MLKIGDEVRLTNAEKQSIEAFVGESIAPVNASDVTAWLDVAIEGADEGSPEERLMAAVFAGMKDKLAASSVA